jgi:undecaprenyl-diphosphatase
VSFTLIFTPLFLVMSPDHSTMSILQSAVLGVVEGLTEFLPVSSTGHIILTQRMLGIGKGKLADAYAICLQAGAIFAVLAIYFSRVKGMLLGLLGKDEKGLMMAIKVIVAFIPAAIIGKLFDEFIDQHLLRMWNVVAAWFIGGVAILAVVKYRPQSTGGFSLEKLTLKHALIIGIVQCIAMWPGTSRSLVTIVGGILVGLELTAAVEFSFLLGLLTLTAATAYKGLKYGSAMVHDYGVPVLAVGCVAAAVSAFIAVKWMVSYLQRRGFAVFGYYRIFLAIATAALILTGHISGE